MVRKCHSLGELRSIFGQTEYSPELPGIPVRLACPSTLSKPRLSETAVCPSKGVQKPTSQTFNTSLISLPKIPTSKTGLSYFDRRHGGTSPARTKHRKATSPDRFLPSREADSSPETQYRVTLGHSLRPCHTKGFRQRTRAVDPFFQPASARTVNDLVLLSPTDHRLIPRNRPRLVDDPGFVEYLRAPGHNPGNSDDDVEDVLRFSGVGALWHIGGGSPVLGRALNHNLSDHGGVSGMGTVAPRYRARFERKATDEEQQVIHEARVALALDIHPASRILGFTIPSSPPDTPSSIGSPTSLPARTRAPLTWKDSAWGRDADDSLAPARSIAKHNGPFVPTVPFRVLDAPFLRNDFYSTILAFCHTTHVLAVGLSSRVYLWSEQFGVRNPPLQPGSRDNHVTSLAFSSQRGGHSILAIGRRYGQLCLWSTFDRDARFNECFPVGVACVVFKDNPTIQPSGWFPRTSVTVEHLAVGDDAGNVWYYIIEWSTPRIQKRHGWDGNMTLVARIAAHTLQVCGLTWSPNGKYFVTGGNDNICLVFDTDDIFSDVPHSKRPNPSRKRGAADTLLHSLDHGSLRGHRKARSTSLLSTSTVKNVIRAMNASKANERASVSPEESVILHPGQAKHRLKHHAAVKAIAFAHWQPTLLATGGGTNDRCIRFWHAPTGALLATIKVYAQVTSLIWSKTKREIAATFGYTQPHHPYRVAVFAWPSCKQMLAIPWEETADAELHDDGERPGRALWAISFPGGPKNMPIYGQSSTVDRPEMAASDTVRITPDRSPSHPAGLSSPTRGRRLTRTSSCMRDEAGRPWSSRSEREGCIVIACSDESIKFQEVWAGDVTGLGETSGVFGGSQILESLHGVDTIGGSKETIR